MSSLILALLSSVPILHLAVRSPMQEKQPAALPKAEELLAKLEADVGTSEARAKVRNLVITGTLTAEGMPGEGKIEQIHAGPDQVRWNLLFPCMPEAVTQGTTGTYSWSLGYPAMGLGIREGADRGAE